MFDNLADFDPMLQIAAVLAVITFVSIAGYKIWRYLQRRRRDGRSRKTWF